MQSIVVEMERVASERVISASWDHTRRLDDAEAIRSNSCEESRSERSHQELDLAVVEGLVMQKAIRSNSC